MYYSLYRYRSTDNWEVIDETDSAEYADYLLGEYRAYAFGSDGNLKVVEDSDTVTGV